MTAPIPVFVPYDFQKNPQVNLALEQLSSLPSPQSTRPGYIFSLASTGAFYIDTGTQIRRLLDDLSALPAHVHSIANITNLQTTLDGKSDIAHSHANATTSVAGFMSATDKTKLDTVAQGAQPNAVTKVFNRTGDVVATNGDYTAAMITFTPVGNIAAATVQAALAELDSEKALASHTHPISEITNLQTTLDSKSPVGHTHVSTNITDFATAVDNRVVAYFDTVAGTDDQYDSLREIIDRLKTIDTTQINPRTKVQLIGNGVDTSFAITHNFATLAVIISVYDVATGTEVQINKAVTNTNVVTITSNKVHTNNELRVVIIAGA